MLLVDLIEANPQTKFILFHSGFPWIGETGAIVMRRPRQVWVDSVWLPTLSYTMAKRAFHEWPKTGTTKPGFQETAVLLCNANANAAAPTNPASLP